MNCSPARAAELLSGFAGQRILVLGDLMLDRYVQGRVERISPEAPVPVVHVHEEHAVPGGACNVAMNLQALGAQGVLAGLVGEDAAGEELRSILGDAGVEISLVQAVSGLRTITKTRVLAGVGQQQICRVDREGGGFGEAVARTDFAASVGGALAECQGVIFEDYAKGLLQPGLVRQALDQAQAAGIPSGFDPKYNRGLDLRGVTVVKPNRREALHFAGEAEDGDGDGDPLRDAHLLAAGRKLLASWQPSLLLITLGGDGMLLLPREGDVAHVPTRAREVFDVSGAGDTVIAVFLAGLAAGGSFLEAAELANVAAGLVVAKLGTATCTPDELLAGVEALW